MKKKILISVVIVSLNTKKDFIKTLNSSINQSLKYKEIIVIDGLSNDGTVNFINKNKKKISKIVIEKDKGIYDAMNKGIKLSKGKWIIFMNSGDLFYNENILKKLSKVCLNYKNSRIIFGNTIIDNGYINYQVRGNYFRKNSVLMPFCHQSSIVKSSLLKKRLFNLNYTLSSDFDFFYDCYLNNIKFLKQNYIISKVKSDGKSDKSRQKVLFENIKVFFHKSNYSKILFLYFLKLYELLKSFIKIFMTKNLIFYILKIKYKKNLKI